MAAGKQKHRCSRCKKWKQQTGFHKDKRRPSGLALWCKVCRAEYDSTRGLAVKEFLYDYLKKNPCIDCGEKDVTVLEFDHVRGKKVMAIGNMVYMPLPVVKKEVKKCVVRCANCHRRKTAAERNFWSYRKASEVQNAKKPKRKTPNTKKKSVTKANVSRARRRTRRVRRR